MHIRIFVTEKFTTIQSITHCGINYASCSPWIISGVIAMLRIFKNLIGTLACALISLAAHAGYTTLNFNGSVTGFWSLPIVEDDFPAGTPVSINLTYDNYFIGLPTSQFYLGMSPSLTGTLDLGGKLYTLNAMSLSYFSYGPTADDPSPNYGFHVTGSGPNTDDGEPFSGMDLFFGLLLEGRPSLIGFGNTNWHVADNGYMFVAGQSSYTYAVPSPGSLSLVLAGLSLLGWRRMHRKTLT